jgi:WD40 repeat protein
MLEGHSDAVHLVVFSPDSICISFGSSNNTLQIWDMVSGAHLNMLEGHSTPVHCVAFSLDGTHVVSRFENQTV